MNTHMSVVSKKDISRFDFSSLRVLHTRIPADWNFAEMRRLDIYGHKNVISNQQ